MRMAHIFETLNFPFFITNRIHSIMIIIRCFLWICLTFFVCSFVKYTIRFIKKKQRTNKQTINDEMIQNNMCSFKCLCILCGLRLRMFNSVLIPLCRFDFCIWILLAPRNRKYIFEMKRKRNDFLCSIGKKIYSSRFFVVRKQSTL